MAGRFTINWADLLLIFTFAFLLRILNLPVDPITDELYHLLAASSLLTTGELTIADGEYFRAWVFTYLVAMVIDVFGNSLVAVRTFCVVLGALLVVGVFGGVHRIAGRGEAWIAGIMLALMPGAIFLSQYIRFYSLHALTFWGASICLYLALTDARLSVRRIVLSLLAMILLFVSLHLQISTAIGAVGLATWAFLYNAKTLWRYYVGLRLPVRILIVVVVLSGLAMAIGAFLETLLYFFEFYRGAPLWSAGQSAFYYVRLYQNQFGVFWALFPMATVVALLTKPRPAFFCTVVFITALVLQSFGGLQAERFSFYAMPFFVSIWGIALLQIGNVFVRLSSVAITRIGFSASKLSSVRTVSIVLLTSTLFFAALSTPALELTVKMTLDKPAQVRGGQNYYWSRYSSSWSTAKDTLIALIRNNDVLLTTQGLHALYFLGDFDYELNATRLSDFEWMNHGNLDPRTGRPVIGSSDGLREVVACHLSGVLVIHAKGWRRESIVDVSTADWIEQNLLREFMPDASGLLAFSWSRNAVDASCSQAGDAGGRQPR